MGLFHSKTLRMSETDVAHDLVAAWLRKEDDVLNISGKPTLNTLATHLQSIGQNGLAQEILSTHGECILNMTL